MRRDVAFFNPQEGKGYFWIDENTVDFTGYEVSELMAGGMDNYQIGSQAGYFENVGQEDGLFAQDDWRFNRRLTINLGIRWDLLTHPYEAHNQQAAFDVNTGTVLEAGVNGVSPSIIAQDYKNFGPRVGFAYDLFGDGKTVVRGGYGMFYFPDYGGIGNQLGEQVPFAGSSSYPATNGYCTTFTGQLQLQRLHQPDDRSVRRHRGHRHRASRPRNRGLQSRASAGRHHNDCCQPEQPEQQGARVESATGASAWLEQRGECGLRGNQGQPPLLVLPV
jgi:hypothetical protein